MIDDPAWRERLARLRSEFDASFAAPRATSAEATEALLLIRTADEPLALRLSELVALEAGRRVVPVPGAPDELLGIAGVRGRLVPVYGLAALLRGAPTDEEGRWLALCGEGGALALAFAGFDGHAEVPRASLGAGEAPAREHITTAVRAGGALRGVVSLPSIVAAIARRTGRAATGGAGA